MIYLDTSVVLLILLKQEGAAGELKSLDAIHLATATLLDRPRDPVTVLTHDARLAAAARARSLAVVDPLAA